MPVQSAVETRGKALRSGVSVGNASATEVANDTTAAPGRQSSIGLCRRICHERLAGGAGRRVTVSWLRRRDIGTHGTQTTEAGQLTLGKVQPGARLDHRESPGAGKSDTIVPDGAV